MGTEYELKYRATPEQLDAIRARCGGEFAVTAMETTYYDTKDHAVSARRWTLRHRREGDTDVCTLKTPAPGNARGEWEVTGCSIGAALPRLAELSGETLPKEEDLIVACGARFTRQAARIEESDFTAELALDQGVLLGGGREMAFSEAELELKSGSREALVGYAAAFAHRFGLEPEPRSKFARAVALAQEG